MTSMLSDPTLEALLERLHAQSRGQSRGSTNTFVALSNQSGQPLVDTGAKLSRR